MANKSKYSKELVLKIKELIEKNNTPTKDICSALGISTTAFYEWQDEKSKKYKEGLTAIINQAREVFWNRTVDEIENALKKRAIGYDYEEVANKERTNPQGDKWVEVKRTTRHVPADPKSATIILNRANRYYMNKQTIEIDDTSDAFDLLKSIENGINGKAD